MNSYYLSRVSQGSRFSALCVTLLLSAVIISSALPAAAVPDSCKVQPSKPAGIQQAINRGCSTIVVSAGTYNERLDIPADAKVSIESESDASSTFIDAGAAGTVVRVRSGAQLTLMGLTIQNGNGYNGGVRNFMASLTLINSRIINNQSVQGGGIYNYYGTVSLIDSTIENNSASYAGGGIFSEFGTVTLSNSLVTNNSTGDVGGGMFNNGGIVTINDSSVTDNEAVSQGGGIFNNKGTLRVTNSLVTGNIAGNNGGGIQNLQGAYSIQNSTVAGNSPNDIAGDPSMG